jgi:hypothetical protein
MRIEGVFDKTKLTLVYLFTRRETQYPCGFQGIMVRPSGHIGELAQGHW